MVDSGRKLHLYINDQNKGVLATSIPDPCYFVFDLFSHCTKVTKEASFYPLHPQQILFYESCYVWSKTPV